MYRNSERYADPTAGSLMRNGSREDWLRRKRRRLPKLLRQSGKKKRLSSAEKSVPSSARLITVRQHGFWHGQSLWFQSKLVMEGMNDTDSY